MKDNRNEFVEPFNSGIKDCNGVYICRGDTISEEHLLNGRVIEKTQGIVKFESGCFFIDMGRFGTYNLRDREQYVNVREFSDPYRKYVNERRFTIISMEEVE